MKYFYFRQNNSFGRWVGPIEFFVRAKNAEEANMIAMEKGEAYFNGVRKGIDCPCCGDRWCRVDDSDGYDVPSCYGTPLDEDELKTTIIYDSEKTPLSVDFQI